MMRHLVHDTFEGPAGLTWPSRKHMIRCSGSAGRESNGGLQVVMAGTTSALSGRSTDPSKHRVELADDFMPDQQRPDKVNAPIENFPAGAFRYVHNFRPSQFSPMYIIEEN
eukprot:scaffold35258_cov23-Prasinocladus_malaysianus.AAC.1